MSTDEYTTVRLPKELVEEIDTVIRHGVLGYKSRAEFIKEAIRDKLKTTPTPAQTAQTPEGQSLEHFNLSEHGVRVLDRTLGDGIAKGRIIDVYFKQEKVWCEYCDATNCQHVKFATNIPEVQKILKEKGWKIKE